jgi:alkane 1-monooxygenase
MQEAATIQGDTAAADVLEPGVTTQRLAAGEVARIFARHLLALAFPLNALAFVLTGPHTWYVALAFVVPIIVAVRADRRSTQEERPPSVYMPAWPFDALLLLLTALQLLNVALLVRMFTLQSLASTDAVMAMIVVGSASGYSGIVVAHELIHRTSPAMRQLGRLLLCTVLYEHFSVEHVRGHHLRVGTPDDPATARFDETFARFYIRTVPAQFKSAWRLEQKRLGDEDMKLFNLRTLGNRVLHGLLVEWGAAFAVLAYLGAAPFVVLVLQAWWATRALEVVNYFEHWGLTRSRRKVMPSDSWDTHSRFTYYALTGLSRHADHHAFASRPFQQLRTWQESPKLPYGYLGMFPLVLAQNTKFRALMSEELKRRKLGPFLEDEGLADAR